MRNYFPEGYNRSSSDCIKGFDVIQGGKHTSPKAVTVLWLTEHFTYELCNIFFSAWQDYCWCVWKPMLRTIWTFILSLQDSTESSCRTDEQSECQQTVKQDYMEPSVQTLSLLGSLISHRLLVWHRPESTCNRCKPLSVFLLHTCKSSSKT